MSAPARLGRQAATPGTASAWVDRKSTRLNSSHSQISYAVFCLKKKKKNKHTPKNTYIRITMQAAYTSSNIIDVVVQHSGCATFHTTQSRIFVQYAVVS